MDNIGCIFDHINNKQNLFITGPAGCGKSYLIDEIVKTVPKKIYVTSSTGISATHINGVTIHSFLGIGIETDLKKITGNKYFRLKASHYADIDILIIDEISMISAELFDTIYGVLQYVKKSELPFGGVQMICLGDFFQLPPVNGNFTFKSKYWHLLKPFSITKIYRQTDKHYIDILNKIRLGDVDESVVSVIHDRIIDNNTSQDKLYLFPKNREADKINTSKFNEISKNNEIKTYTMSLVNTKNFTLMPEKLEVCIGCKVILLVNLNQGIGLINGSVGTVKKFSHGCPFVEFENGVETTVSKYIWTSEDKKKSISQIPLKLAYALSIHKSQGMTLENAILDLSDCFSHGQTYVALSRIKTLDGVNIINFDEKSIIIDEDVKNYYKTIID